MEPRGRNTILVVDYLDGEGSFYGRNCACWIGGELGMRLGGGVMVMEVGRNAVLTVSVVNTPPLPRKILTFRGCQSIFNIHFGHQRCGELFLSGNYFRWAVDVG